MRRRPVGTSPEGETETSQLKDDKPDRKRDEERIPRRSAALWLSLLFLMLNGWWAVYHFQFERLPVPLSAKQAGKRGFAEELAMRHVKTLTELGPHPVGSDALDLALQYVLATSEEIKKTAHWEVDVEVDTFHTEAGANIHLGGMFKGKTLIYSDLTHVVLKILPKYLSEAEDNVILVSSHIDTVFSTEGAGDCSSCVAVMLELARGVSQWAHGFKSGVIFLFNTGEEEGLSGAHSFMTQHPWRKTVRFFVDLEAIGVGGKSAIFQSGSAPWAIEMFAKVAKYPSAQIISQDLFNSGLIKSATDFQVYSEIGGLSGLDFAYMDSSAVYHTKNDKLELLKPGSLQHLGDNMLSFLVSASTSSSLLRSSTVQGDPKDKPIFFDILGTHMVVYSQRLARILQNSVILQALVIWTASSLMGGWPAVVSLGLSVLAICLMWICSLSLAVMVAFLLPLVCDNPTPYIASPWLVLGLFGAPAVVGALVGQNLGFLILHKYLLHAALERKPASVTGLDLRCKLESERWLFKSGFLQWLIFLILGSFFGAGSTYVSLVWLISPAFAYGFFDATLTPARSPKQLRTVTLILALGLPILISGGVFMQLGGFATGSVVRFDRNPGGVPDWLGNVIIAVLVVSIVCLTFVYLLSYIHLSGAKSLVIVSMGAIFALTLAATTTGIIPTFTDDVARAVNVVHIVDSTATNGRKLDPISHISIFSNTPGKLKNEVANLKDEEFSCGRNQTIDLVTFTVNYGCHSLKDSSHGWNKSDIPALLVQNDSVEDTRTTRVLLDTKSSTRWSLAINSKLIQSFSFEGESIEVNNRSTGDAWHVIQYAGGKKSPTKFTFTLIWSKESKHSSKSSKTEKSDVLLKLRTDVNRITPKTARVLEKLPSWCSLFGKSTSPLTLAFLANLPIEF